MREWHAKGPVGSRFERVRLRILAYHEQHHPKDGTRRLVVQTMEGGDPIPEAPLFEGRVTHEELADYIEQSINEGWRLAACPV